MKEFPGSSRRTYLELPKGRMAHLPKGRAKKSTGPVSYCGRIGGTLIGWSEAKFLPQLCTTCAVLSGVAPQLEAQPA